MLTDAAIRKLPETAADRLIAAGGREGLYLRHRATGRKTWVVRRRVDGSWRVETLGDWPVLTALNARRRAATTEAAKASPLTFGQAAEQFYNETILPRYRGDPAKSMAYFTRDAKSLASRRLDAVKRSDIAALVRAKAATHPAAAGKLLALIKRLYRWALIAELVDSDPTSGLTPGALNLAGYEPRDRVLTDDELKALWKLPDEPYGRLLRFAVLTGCRIGEAIQFAPEQVVGDVWVIPMTKSGRAHTLPLAPAAAELAGAGWPRRKYESLMAAINTESCTWRPHDLRRTAATRMRDAGVSIEVIEAVLNHAPPRLIKTYQRPNMLPAMREALMTLQAVIDPVVKAKS